VALKLSREDVTPVLAIMVGVTLSTIAIAGVVTPSPPSRGVVAAPATVVIEEVGQEQGERVQLETRRRVRVQARERIVRTESARAAIVVVDGVRVESSQASEPVIYVDGVRIQTSEATEAAVR
jgi:hypothetical protein